jgi:hypothetical protein
MRWRSRLQGQRAAKLQALIGNKDLQTLTESFDALLDIPGLWDGMRLTTLHNMLAMKCDTVGCARMQLAPADSWIQELVRYLRHIREVWSQLVGGDKDAMGKIDTATVKALELRAPQASKKDAEVLRAHLRDGTAFGAFNASERNDIWSRLQKVEGLIPSLFTFFKDITNLELCSNPVRRLTARSQGLGVFDSLQDKFTGVNQVEGRVKIQVAEHDWIYSPGTVAEQKDLGCRQIYAYAMRNYPCMPREPSRENSLKKAIVKADSVVLGRFADLAYQLGFSSDEIIMLRQYRVSVAAPDDYPPLGPPPIRAGSDLAMSERCGIPRSSAYEEARESLFLNHLHEVRQGEGVTAFFVRQSIYFAFFGRLIAQYSNKDGGCERSGFPSDGFWCPTERLSVGDLYNLLRVRIPYLLVYKTPL